MIIDAHTHVLPDSISITVEDMFSARSASLYGSYKISNLLNSMEECEIDTSIIFCIAERPKVVEAANDFVIRVQDKKRIVFA